jgi:hypothetical protein
MADSNALRQRRKRSHAAGDHSPCRHRGVLAAVEAGPGAWFDAGGEMTRLAGWLEAAHIADPGNAAIARELRLTLLALAGQKPDEGDPVLAELMAMAAGTP